MADSRTIRLDDDVYERLASMKRTDESFSAVIDRLLDDPSLLDLYGVREAEGTEALRAAIAEANGQNGERVAELRDQAREDG